MLGRRVAIVLPIVLVAASAGPSQAHNTVPLINYERQSWTAPAGRPMSLDAIRQAIGKAAVAERWQVDSSGEQWLRVRFVRGKHTIWVRIVYDHTTFSLLYDRSENMSYWKSEIGRTLIHPSYNAWVHNLRLAILYELEKM